MPVESPGRLILLVGPSGAGKDTLLDYARDQLRADPRIHFVRRIVSRPAGAGEDHEAVDQENFKQRVLDGHFALHWQAHDLSYGIPSQINVWLERGDVVVANGSRAILSEARRRYSQLLVVNVTAPMEVLAKRLVERGRENQESIRRRLIRGDQHPVEGIDIVQIDNSGLPEIAADFFLAVLTAQVGETLRGAVRDEGAPY
ncbi:phosphonate metabolism protein/1,5-bisphosphokinase (PRPP-forming) PhnN [Phyllobacterium chamaecytisi]|uniref:phosphonate metabolism protein/1,5-bisphosphokinase (PRPP-forming) PhnN n=1 Tax=Phyllobacterium chamaecytisi TaxID=2876082 RepID=UPI001CCE3BAD|nr:phosphonate metabolism protein/1,5-bisphosphokinase (PRPP-forming) PhnN [Phyllobacterium sp. KW56]MBZ9603018.1 phosphonate metabolism protein/1,5-bisphosphokinase (PRPP-forming) PhnN [Phyllobacterium sp. KW56]